MGFIKNRQLIFIFINVYMLLSQDSIPRVRIVYSAIYQTVFSKENPQYTLRLLQEKTKAFLEVYEANILQTLAIIPLYTGYSWPKNYAIEIYPVVAKQSFSHPLTLMYHDDPYFMFFILIHELVHQNIENVSELQFPDSDMKESFCDKVAEKVAMYLDSNIHDKRQYSLYYGHQKYIQIDLDSMNLKEWMTQNKQNAFLAFKLLENLSANVLHQAEDSLDNILSLIYKLGIQEYTEKAYLKLIHFYQLKNQFLEMENYANRYLRNFPEGALSHEVRFILANCYFKNGEKEKAEKLLIEITSANTEVNNHLDDSYFLLGNLSLSNGNSDRSLINYLYVIQQLPNGFARADASRQLARIFMRKKNESAASYFYDLAMQLEKNPNTKAQLLIEINETMKVDKLKWLKNEIATLLGESIRQDLRKRLEMILKELL